MPLAHGIDGGAAGLVIRQLGLHEIRAVAGQPIRVRRAASDHHGAGALLGQHLGDAGPDARAAARHHHHLARQVQVHQAVNRYLARLPGFISIEKPGIAGGM